MIQVTFIDQVTAAVAAYEAAMVRPLEDAPPRTSKNKVERALVWSPDVGRWVDGGIFGDPGCEPMVIASGHTGDIRWTHFRLLPDAPETKP